MSTAKSVEATRKRMESRGLKRVEVWARPEDCSLIKAYAFQLRQGAAPLAPKKAGTKPLGANSVFALGAA